MTSLYQHRRRHRHRRPHRPRRRRRLHRKSISRVCDVTVLPLKSVYVHARASASGKSDGPCVHVHTHTHANLALARSKGERRPGRQPMCRTGSVSIRPDSCGLLYAPQVLSFLPLPLSLTLSGLVLSFVGSLDPLALCA